MKKVTETVEEVLATYLDENGLYIWDTEFVKEGKDWYLRVLVDKQEGYIGSDDCEKLSRFLSDKLDELDMIEQNYILEVSSPGMDRKLTKPMHFEKCMGQMVDIKLYKPMNGEKEISGILTGYGDEGIVIERDGESVAFPSDTVSKVSLTVIF